MKTQTQSTPANRNTDVTQVIPSSLTSTVSVTPINWKKFSQRYSTFQEHNGPNKSADERLEEALLGLISQGLRSNLKAFV